MIDNGNRYSEGGYITGRSDSDLIPAALDNGYIINAATIKRLGLRNLEVFTRELNNRKPPSDDETP